VLFQLGLKAFEQGEGVGRGTGKAGQHLAVVELTHLARRALDNDIAQRDLAVAANGDLVAVRRLAPHADDGGSVKLFHVVPSWVLLPDLQGLPAEPGFQPLPQMERGTTLAYSLIPMTLKNAATRRCTS
jgi:hypothetical protein